MRFAVEKEGDMEVIVEMEETGGLELTITQPDGTPLDGEKISSRPNQKYTKGGSTLLGTRYSSMPGISNQLNPPGKQKPMYSRDSNCLPFVDQPIKDGKADLIGLPVGRKNPVRIQHPDFMFQDAGASTDLLGSTSLIGIMYSPLRTDLHANNQLG